ncbi:MAG: ferritin-like domain-containing protein [Acidobacteria bacterium]|nr:ferritin-like domain-containing protein [Acidobacteriota bacterium]MBV9070814.1 ferritin-like domain-containing protein [Acidobacteriota bacterium]MBV9188493.1 ferritin-like domain-containing protein [Acidobacteriota bacterium]
MPTDARAKLVRQLQGAYSGELAAGYAYRGHWKSLRPGPDCERIKQIEAEEWHHRELVGGLLRQLGGKPSRLREAIFWCIGRAIGAFCHVGGWFAPMYGAGRLERGNIVEYEEAAIFARDCGQAEMIDCILTMAEVEWEHEFFFRSKVTDHWMLRVLKVWPAPPPKATIRERFAAARALSS